MMKLFLMGNVIEDWINALIEALNDYVVEPILGSILNLVGSILNMVWALLCNVIYGLISIFFDVLITIPRINILENVGIEGIYQRVTLIIVIVMTFYITFEVVKYVVQPDTVTDKEKGAGNIAFRLIIVILLIAFVPKIFTMAYDLQAKIISSNVIGKIIFGTNDDSYASLGGDFAANTFSIFYEVNPAICNENTTFVNDGGLCPVIEDTVELNLWLIRNNWSSIISIAPNLSGNLLSGLALEAYITSQGIPTDGRNGNSLQPMIKFQGLLAIIVGVYILWTLIVYGVEVARRYFQLIFLQITAPIAIISYVSPKKDGAFQKWVKQCTTTYLDLFIRLAILYFVLLIMNILHDAIYSGSFMDAVFDISDTSGRIHYANPVIGPIYIFLIIGLLQFLKKAPKLLKELLPSGNAASGEFGMSGKEMIGTAKQIISGTSRTVGGVVGGFRGAKTAITSDKLQGRDKALTAIQAGFQGAKAGFSKGGGIKKASEAGRGAVYKAEDIALAGGDVFGATFRGNHYAQEAKGYERDIAALDGFKKGKSNVSSAVNDTGVVKAANSAKNAWNQEHIGSSGAREKAVKDIEKATRLYSVSSRDASAQATYKASIQRALDGVYNSAKQQVNIDYATRQANLNANITTAREQRDEAQATIERYESIMGPLTAEQMAERDAAIKTRDTTEKQIEDATAALAELEDERRIELSKLDSRRNTEYDEITAKVGAEEEKDNEVRTALEVAQRDANFEYHDPADPELTSMTKEMMMIEIPDPTDPTRTILVDSSDPRYLAAFAEHIGDLDDRAGDIKGKIENHNKVRRAKANADASGKSGK